MQLKRFLAASAVALAALTALPASAQTPCVGFTDVLTTDQICPNVEWLKNRAITLGCTTTTYCPTDPVTRGTMALFMNRLGTALTPVFQRKREPAAGGSVALTFTGQQNICPTDAVTISNYPRTAIVRGLVNLFTPDVGMDIKAWVVYSTDGGTTWITPTTNDGLAYAALYPGQTPPNDVSLYPMNVIDLNVGSSYRFALAAARTTGSGGAVNAYCENLVQLVNRNGSTTPLDAGQSGVHGRGD